MRRWIPMTNRGADKAEEEMCNGRSLLAGCGGSDEVLAAYHD
jgi:hypothetical protein